MPSASKSCAGDFSDKAVRQLDPGDIAKYVVCRVSDEVLVDLMGSARANIPR
jgi:hypothetical protein